MRVGENGDAAGEMTELERVERELESLAGPVRDDLQRVAAQRELVVAELRDLDAARRRLERVLHALGPEQPKKKAAPPKKQAVSEATVERVLAEIRSRPELDRTVADLAGMVGVTTTTTRAALEVLRERGDVRLTGQRKLRAGTARTYRLMDGGGET